MSRFKTAASAPSFSGGVVFKRKGNRVRYIDPATAKVSGWVKVPAVQRIVRLPESMTSDYESKSRVLDKMTVTELRALAGDRGIKVPSKSRKADIIAMLAN